MKTETELAFEKELDTLLDQLAQHDPATDAADLKSKIAVVVMGFMGAHFNRGAASQQALIDATVAQAEGMQTSIIRATVAAVLEVIRNGTAGADEFNSHSITMNLEAQRTIWDRYELTTERDESQENVTFTIHKK